MVLEFIERYVDERRCAPLIREIQVDCQIASYKSAIDRLNALERKGLIKRAPNKHRGIRLIRKTIASHLRAVEEPAAVAGSTPGVAA